MQRSAALRRLSSEHHIGLVIARGLREGADDPQGAWTELQRRFAEDLEPHFRLEELGLLPAMSAAGERALVQRTLADHRTIRTILADGGPEDLPLFATLLVEHIRFEEGELFETAQRVLAPEALAALEGLHDREIGPVCTAGETGARPPD